MQCMEVWGGNQSVDSGVVMAGLDAWVYCRPYAAVGADAPAAAGGDVYFVSSCATGRIARNPKAMSAPAVASNRKRMAAPFNGCQRPM